MAYVRVNPVMEYDPETFMIRQDGKERPAGFGGLAFAGILNQQQTAATSAAAEAPKAAGEAPKEGVRASAAAPARAAAAVPRDEVPTGSGLTMESGAPKIELNEKPAVNQYNYTGPASRNPYFTTPGNPLREGYVAGFSNWYTSVNVASSLPGGAGAYTMNRILCATEEGAQEALRLVQEHVPDARLEQSQWGTWGGPFAADKATFDVVLPNGGRLNAGAVLNCYYHGGQGCSVYSDMNLTNSINLLKSLPS